MTAQTPGTAGVTGGQSPPVTEQARQAAGTATEEGKHVAATAGQEAKQVAGEVKQQARNLAGELSTQAADQTRTQRDRLVLTLHELSDELDTMASSGGGSGLARDLVRQASQKARELSSKVEGREPGDLLEDLRSLARRRPGAFLLGAAALGVVAGRLTRGGVAAAAESTGAGDVDAYRTGAPTTSAAGSVAGPPATVQERTPTVPGPEPVIPPAAVAGVEPTEPGLEPGRPGAPGRATSGGLP